MMTMPVCMLSVTDLVFKSTHEHAVSRQLTHVHAAQFPHLRRYAVLLDQRLLHAHTHSGTTEVKVAYTRLLNVGFRS